MDKRKKINRKKFFKWSSLALLVPLAYLWDRSVSSRKALSNQKQQLTIDPDLPDGVHFFGRVILVKNAAGLRLLSAKCTHLGCRINKMEDGELVCPCHGSRYDLSGIPVKGPAVTALPLISYRSEEKEGALVLEYKL